MQKIRISSVEYTNSLPFIYGIEHSDVITQIELSKNIPSVCAEKLITDQVDIGLIPVAMIPKLKFSEIISDYCIGATGKVRTVVLAANSPIDELETIQLDPHSRSGAMLCKILCKNHWKKKVNWEESSDGFEKEINNDKTGGVVIGDKVFGIESRYKYIYDLAEEWEKFTGLPFVFAAWVANKSISNEFVFSFNQSLKRGIESIAAVIKMNNFKNIPVNVDMTEYLSKNIDYKFDDEKKKGLELFLHLIKEYETEN